MGATAKNGGAARDRRVSRWSRRQCGGLLIAATLGLQPGAAFAQNIFGIIDGLARYHGDYPFGRSHAHTHRSSHHRSAHADESSTTHGSESAGSSGPESRGPDLTPAR